MTTTVEIGYAGSNTGSHGYTIFGKFQPASDITVTSIGFRTYTGSVSVKIGITDNSSWLGWSENVSTTSQGWTDVTLSPSVSLTAGTDYYIGMVADTTSFSVYSDTGFNDFWGNSNVNYRPSNYAAAFDASAQGTPIVNIAGGEQDETQNFRYTYGSSPVAGSTVTIPPPVAMVRF